MVGLIPIFILNLPLDLISLAFLFYLSMYLLHILFYHAKRDSKREIPTSVKQDGGSGVKPGEQANTEPEEGGGRKQGSNQANDERKVKILHQLLQL